MNGTVEDPLAWRSFADGDLQTARVLSAREDAEDFARIIIFHAHQAAEKYLKGLLVANNEEPPRIHALPELLRRATIHVSHLDTPEIWDAVNGLNAYYIPTRYPVEAGGADDPIVAEDATEALAWAEGIASAVRPRLVADTG